jgi:hypothetical protein
LYKDLCKAEHRKRLLLHLFQKLLKITEGIVVVEVVVVVEVEVAVLVGVVDSVEPAAVVVGDAKVPEIEALAAVLAMVTLSLFEPVNVVGVLIVESLSCNVVDCRD